MALGRYLVDAVLLEGRNLSQLAKRHGISAKLGLRAPGPLSRRWL